MLNSSWIGDSVTGVGDGLFSGSVRVGVSNKTVETDPECKKSSLSLSLPAGREDGKFVSLTSGYMITLIPMQGAASILIYGLLEEA